MYLFVDNDEIKDLVDEYSKNWERLVKMAKKEKEIVQAEKNSNLVKQRYQQLGFIFGYLIIKYDPQFRHFFIMNEDRFDTYYTSSLINYTESKAGFDIIIKDN